MVKNLNSIQAFRQKIAALDDEEINVACEILVSMHPQSYFNALNNHYLSLLKFNNAISSVCTEQHNEYQRLIGEVVAVDLTMENSDEVSESITSDVAIDDGGDSLDNTDIMSGSEINVPAFLTTDK